MPFGKFRNMSSVHTGHEYFEASLPDLATGQLDSALRAELEHHVASCESCERTLAALKAVIPLLPGAATGNVPVHYFSNVLPRIRERIDHKQPAKENVWVSRVLAPLTALMILIGLVTQVSLDSGNGLRTILQSLRTDELADVLVEQAEQQSLYLIPSTESLASSLPERVITRELAASVLEGDDIIGLQAVSDLSEDEMDMVVARLVERTIL